MAKLRSITISSLQDFTEFIQGLPDEESHWYRGCGKASDELVPTLYRHPQKTKIAERLQLEKDLLSWFKDRSMAYQTREFENPWRRLFFMQHFRVPTRLLDWTENPFIALYFALTHARHKYRDDGTAEYQRRAAVWVLEPGLWNQRALDEMLPYDPRIPSPDDARLDAHKPRSDEEDLEERLRDRPVAMFGIYDNLRIAAQRGTFVIFGKKMSPMEDIYTQNNFPADSLVKLEIVAKSIPGLLDSLRALGITDSVVFPDLEGLGMEARRDFGFEV